MSGFEMASKFVGRVSPPPNLGAHICLVRIERGDGEFSQIL